MVGAGSAAAAGAGAWLTRNAAAASAPTRSGLSRLNRLVDPIKYGSSLPGHRAVARGGDLCAPPSGMERPATRRSRHGSAQGCGRRSGALGGGAVIVPDPGSRSARPTVAGGRSSQSRRRSGARRYLACCAGATGDRPSVAARARRSTSGDVAPARAGRPRAQPDDRRRDTRLRTIEPMDGEDRSPHAHPAIRRLRVLDDEAVRGLAALLVDSVGADASVGFMYPLAPTRAQAVLAQSGRWRRHGPARLAQPDDRLLSPPVTRGSCGILRTPTT